MEPTLDMLDAASLRAALSLRDLTDADHGAHAMQQLLAEVVDALQTAWRCPAVVHRSSPVITVADNYDRLNIPPDAVARDAVYTRYVTSSMLLRTHTTAMIPGLLRVLAGAVYHDTLLVCPGLVYRRDCIDRLHTGEPHQLDLWRVWHGTATVDDLGAMARLVVTAALPDATDWRWLPTTHPYTEGGRQLEVRLRDAWIEVGECGVASPAVLREAGLRDEATGLAMGLGLDRLLMLRKGIDDIRLLRSTDPRVRRQMTDLAPYRPVSRYPAIRRDLSIAVDVGLTPEGLGDQVRVALGPDATSIEEIRVVAETALDDLPPAAIARLGIRPGQKNVLLRLVVRDLDRTLTHADANALRDRVYLALHRGDARELTGAP